MAGGLKVEGGQQLRALAVELKTADRTLWLATTRQLRALAKPAALAVQAEERRVLPKRGGLNEWVASAKVGVRITTTGRSAGVTLTQGRNSGGARAGAEAVATARVRFSGYGNGRLSRSNLRLAEQQGLIRHPNRGGPRWSIDRRDEAGGWSSTRILSGWFERPLLAMEPEAQAAMKAAMDETARVAGFRGP